MAKQAENEFAYPLDIWGYSAKHAQAYHGTYTTGIYASDEDLIPKPVGGMNIELSSGHAWLRRSKFNSVVYVNFDSKRIKLDAGDTRLKRIDRIVVRWDVIANSVYSTVKKGKPASEPTPPVLQRDESAFEIAICDVSIDAGALSISHADIRDLRLNESLCGLMRDGVTGIPTQSLYDSFNDWLNKTKIEHVYWVEGLKDILDENAAGNLYNLLTEHTNNTDNPHEMSKDQLGLELVDNTPDKDKAVGMAETIKNHKWANQNVAMYSLERVVKVDSNSFFPFVPSDFGLAHFGNIKGYMISNLDTQATGHHMVFTNGRWSAARMGFVAYRYNSARRAFERYPTGGLVRVSLTLFVAQ